MFRSFLLSGLVSLFGTHKEVQLTGDVHCIVIHRVDRIRRWHPRRAAQNRGTVQGVILVTETQKRAVKTFRPDLFTQFAVREKALDRLGKCALLEVRSLICSFAQTPFGQSFVVGQAASPQIFCDSKAAQEAPNTMTQQADEYCTLQTRVKNS